MALKTYKDLPQNIGGRRVALLLILFVLALYSLITTGFPAFAAICLSPIFIIVVMMTFSHGMAAFWTLIVVNYFIMWHGMPSLPIPMSLPNEMLEILLLVLALINIQDSHFERCANVMFLALIVWCSFCTLEILNDTCDMGIDITAWYQGVRLMAFQLLYIFLIFSVYISSHV
jgi:hypothetical protein